MPNTLAHIGVQTLLGRTAMPGADLKWVLLACVIPDISWIIQVLCRRLTDVNLIDLRLYAVVQSTLLFCLILAAALACVSRRPGRTFMILALGTFMHLLLDATQTKLGNGVVLFAPFNWQIINFELYWPEQLPSYALTIFGALTLVFLWWRGGPAPYRPQRPTGPRMIAAIALFLVWISAPVPLMRYAEAADLHNTQTLRAADRVGASFTVDRNNVMQAQDGTYQLQSWTGQIFRLQGVVPPKAQNISLRGTFIAQDQIAIDVLHVHRPGPREWFSYTGLLAVLMWWVHGLFRGLLPPTSRH